MNEATEQVDGPQHAHVEADDDGVLVVGAGPVGLSAAIQLALGGVRCVVVEQMAAPSPISRATDLHARTMELFDHFGVAEQILRAAIPISGVRFFSGNSELGCLNFGECSSDMPAAVSVSESIVEEILEARLAQLGVKVQREVGASLVRQTPDSVTVELTSADGSALREFRWVIACDGLNSGFRKALGIDFVGEDYPGRWSVMDARIDDWPHSRTEIPVYLDSMGFWAMALASGRIRLFFRGTEQVPSPADAQAVLDRQGSGATVFDAVNCASFKLQHRIASRFRQGNVFLAGDAAHVCTPVGGPGMNTGVQDAVNIAWKLAIAQRFGASETLLDSYEAERWLVDKAAIDEVHDLQHGNLQEDPAAVASRDLALAQMLRSPVAQREATDAGHELRVFYDASPIVIESGEATQPAPGHRMPNAQGLIDGHTPVTLRGLLASGKHQVLFFGEGQDLALAVEGIPSVSADGWNQLADVWVVTGQAGNDRGSSADVGVIHDPKLEVHGALEIQDPGFVVVRPDGYVGARGPLDSAPSHLQRYFTPLT